MNEKIILTPDPARIMESLRDTGYDFNTAMADLVDNSIAAGATKIDVEINLSPNNEVTVYIADNGCGMNFDELKNAMTYGSAKRPDPSSLGKFGLGLKTASTAFCRRLSVLSKSSTSKYNKVRWDLDYVVQVNEWELTNEPLNQEEIDLLELVTEGSSGTLVIWEKVDRLLKSYSSDGALKNAYKRIVANLTNHFSLVYQRFIDKEFSSKPIEIVVNNVLIEPFDPFCRTEKNRKVLVSKTVPVEMPNGEKKSFDISAILLPRVDEFSSSEAHSKARINNDNEGFYIYRENRLIHHGDWLGIFTNDPHYALLRIEFSFNHELDELFNIDIKKSRIALNEDIYDYLKNRFLPSPRQEANDLYRATQAKKSKDKNKDSHSKSNNTIAANASQMVNSKVDIIDKSNDVVKISNENGSFVGKLKIIDLEDKGNCRVYPEQKMGNPYLWEGSLINGEHAVSINTTHPFYPKVYAKIDNSDVIAGIDYLLWALAEAELSTYSDEVKQQYEDMRYQVSKNLKKLVDTLPDPDLGEQ